MIRTIAATLLIVGNVLVVSTIFVPWLLLTTTFSNSFGSGGLSPWTGIVGVGLGHPSLNPFSPFGLVYLFLASAIAGYSLDLLLVLVRRGRSAGWASRGMVIVLALAVLAIAGLLLTGMVTQVVRDGLALGYPYFDVKMGTGAQMALVGALAVLLGGALSRNRQPAVKPVQPDEDRDRA